MSQQTAVIVEQNRAVQADLDSLRAEGRDALDEVLDTLAEVATQREDTLLAMTVGALREVHDLYEGYDPATQASTTGAQARRDIHATISRALRQHRPHVS